MAVASVVLEKVGARCVTVGGLRTIAQGADNKAAGLMSRCNFREAATDYGA